ncbi:MAG: hypothetical protein ABI321_10390 [Polyangia bacterium]
MAHSIGELLVRRGVVSADALKRATARRAQLGGTLGEHLVASGATDEETLAMFFHRHLVLPRIADSRLASISPAILRLVPGELAVEFRVMPIAVDNDGSLLVAMADPSDNHAVEELAFFVDAFILRGVATESALRLAIARHYPGSVPQPATDFDLPIDVQEPEPLLLTRKKVVTSQVEEAPVLLTQPRHSKRTGTLPGLSPIRSEPPLAALRDAKEREVVGTLLLDYASTFVRRVALFVMRRGVLVGHDVRGGGLERAIIEMLSVPLDQPSLFADVVRARVPYRGELPDNAQDHALARSVATLARADVLACPVLVRGRVVALLFGTQLVDPLPDADLQSVLHEAGAAYERIVLAAKVEDVISGTWIKSKP